MLIVTVAKEYRNRKPVEESDMMSHDALNWQFSLMFPWEPDLADVPRACVSLLVYLLYTSVYTIIIYYCHYTPVFIPPLSCSLAFGWPCAWMPCLPVLSCFISAKLNQIFVLDTLLCGDRFLCRVFFAWNWGDQRERERERWLLAFKTISG